MKEATLEQDAMAVVVGLLAAPLGRHPRMSEDDQLLVQLVLTFFRNLLCIPDPGASNGGAAQVGTVLYQCCVCDGA